MQEKSIIKQNILKYLEFKGISPCKFYQDSGITRGVLGQNNGMSEENTTRFIAYCPEINIEWLLTGKGDMLKKSEKHDLLNESSSTYEINYKELAESRLQTINALQESNMLLKEQNTSLNQTKSDIPLPDKHFSQG